MSNHSTPKTLTIEAHGTRPGLYAATLINWRKSFVSVESMIKWVEKHDADVHGTRDLEVSR